MSTVQQSKEEVTKVVAQHHGCCARGLIFVLVVCEIMSHLLVLFVAWFTTAYIIAAYFLAHYVLALLASTLHWWELLQSPLLWLFPPGTGRLVAPSQGGCLGPTTFRVFSWCLRLAAAGYVFSLLVPLPNVPTAQRLLPVFCRKSHDCDGLPPWLRQPWWSDEATCPVKNDGYGGYTTCLEERPWYLRGGCNANAGDCSIDALPGWLSRAAGVLSSFCLLLPPPLSLLLSAALCCCRGPVGRQGDLSAEGLEMSSNDEPEESVSSEDESEEVTLFNQLKFFAFTLFPFVLDVFSDLNGMIQYILTGNFIFAIVSTGIFAMSMAQQLRRGMLHKFGQAAIESMDRAHATDDLEVIMLSEKSTEAAPQLLLQFYAFTFVTSSEFAVWSFLLSMALSLKEAANAVYYLIELDLYHVIAKREFDQLT